MDRDEALGVVERLYAAATGEGEWSQALVAIADALGSSAATLEIHDVASARLLSFDSVRLDPSTIPVYVKDFASQNPRSAFLQRSGHVLSFDHLFLTEGEMDQHPFYADFLAPIDLRYFIAAQTPLLDGHVKGVLAVQRSGRVRGAAEDDIKAMEMLVSHVNRAIGLYWARMRNDIDPGHLDCVLAQHGLTPAERRLARALACNETIRDFARRTGVTMNTVYTHYGRIKHKLDCGRQGELIARLRML